MKFKQKFIKIINNLNLCFLEDFYKFFDSLFANAKK